MPPEEYHENVRDLIFKVLVVGEAGVGKTSLIKRYVHNFFSQHYRPTIGVDFALKVIYWDDETAVRLQLWDIAGQERFGNLTRIYYKEAAAAIIVFDCSAPETFEQVAKWKEDIDSKVTIGPDQKPIPIILLANKCDLFTLSVFDNSYRMQMDEYCRDHGFIGWFETSAKTDVNIDVAAKALVTEVLKNEAALPPRPRPVDLVVVQPKKPDTQPPCCSL